MTAVLPALGCFLAAGGVLAGLFWRNRRRWDLRRVAVVARSEAGGVQSVSFVLTVPLFVFIVMFMVQLSQVMIGLMVVHYAAFAAARAAEVWIPATDANLEANRFPLDIDVRQVMQLDAFSLSQSSDRKREKIWTAAVLACVPIAPSRAVPTGAAPFLLGEHLTALQLFYGRFDSATATNGAIPSRLANKLRYSAAHTRVFLNLRDASSGPMQATAVQGAYHTYNPIGHPRIEYRPEEAGWQDPATLTVQHEFRILPGPARRLAQFIVNDRGAHPIRPNAGVYQITLSASTTMTIEGLKSVRPVREHDSLADGGGS